MFYPMLCACTLVNFSKLTEVKLSDGSQHHISDILYTRLRGWYETHNALICAMRVFSVRKFFGSVMKLS